MLFRRPEALSGGEKQRVAIGRALLSKPRLLLMDEPLAALDFERKAEILPYIERLAHEVGIPILYVNHSLSEVARLASTIVLFSKGQVVSYGPAKDLLADPELVPLLGLHEAGSILGARVKEHHPDGLSVLEASAGKIYLPRINADTGTPIKLRIHANDVMLALTRPKDISALNILEGWISQIRQWPRYGHCSESGGDSLLARITRRSAKEMDLKEGQDIFAVIKSVSTPQFEISNAC